MEAADSYMRDAFNRGCACCGFGKGFYKVEGVKMLFLERLSESKKASIAKTIFFLVSTALVVTLSISAPALSAAYADEEVPVAAEAAVSEEVEDDATPLASFELAPQCWVHWLLASGVVVTVLYCGGVVMSNRRDARELKEFESRALGHSVASDLVANEARQQI